MPIVNRDGDPSEQKDVYDYTGFTVLSGSSTIMFGPLPYPSYIDSVRIAATGISGAPQLRLLAARFIPGAGVTQAIVVGVSNLVLTNFGTSGPQGMSLVPGSGSTPVILLVGDLIGFDMPTVANSITGALSMEVILRKTQDIVSYNGV